MTMAKQDLRETIALAIKEVDTSWFNEDYTKQAEAVLRALHRKGLRICPVEPPEEMVKHVEDNMPFGRLKPADLIREMYRLIIGAS